MEHRRIDAFKSWCWRRFFKVPWTERRSTQSILKEINTEYSLEGLMLKLKLQHFGHLIQTASSLEKTLILRRLKAKEKCATENEMIRWHLRLNEWVQTPGDSKGEGSLACCSSWSHKESDMT